MPRASQASSKQPRILIVDDNAQNVKRTTGVIRPPGDSRVVISGQPEAEG